MTVRDIQHHLQPTLGTELSHETISNITDAVADEVKAWQARPLEEVYPIIYLDALVVKVRDGHQVRNKAAHIAVGVDLDGVKHVLGIWVQASEGAKFWAGVCAELRNRGVRDVLIVCCDGLTGFPEAIEATWPHTIVQTCTVHLIRASMRFVSYADRKAVAAALRPIYTAPTVDAASRAGRVRRLGVGPQVPGDGRGVAGRLGTVHPVPGVPAGAPQDHLHHQRDRVAELPAPEDHQEPRPLPQRRRRDQAALAGDPRHRGQTRPGTRQRGRPAQGPAPQSPTRLVEGAQVQGWNRPSAPSPSPTPTASTPRYDHHQPVRHRRLEHDQLPEAPGDMAGDLVAVMTEILDAQHPLPSKINKTTYTENLTTSAPRHIAGPVRFVGVPAGAGHGLPVPHAGDPGRRQLGVDLPAGAGIEMPRLRHHRLGDRLPQLPGQHRRIRLRQVEPQGPGDLQPARCRRPGTGGRPTRSGRRSRDRSSPDAHPRPTAAPPATGRTGPSQPSAVPRSPPAASPSRRSDRSGRRPTPGRIDRRLPELGQQRAPSGPPTDRSTPPVDGADRSSSTGSTTRNAVIHKRYGSPLTLLEHAFEPIARLALYQLPS